MTSRPHWNVLFCLLVLTTGCQSLDSVFPWQASREPNYTIDELATLDRPVTAAARTRSAGSADDSLEETSELSGIALASYTPPVAAQRVDQLVQSGQAAIRAAGQGHPEKLAEAKQSFEHALSLDNRNSSAHHGLAIVADLQRDWPAAEFHYKQSLSASPQDPNLLNDLGYSYLLQNRFHEASQYLNRAMQVSPQHEHAQVNLALLSLKRGDRSGASERLATIYAPADAQATLAKLEQDVRQSAADAVATDTNPATNMSVQDLMLRMQQERERAAVANRPQDIANTSRQNQPPLQLRGNDPVQQQQQLQQQQLQPQQFVNQYGAPGMPQQDPAMSPGAYYSQPQNTAQYGTPPDRPDAVGAHSGGQQNPQAPYAVPTQDGRPVYPNQFPTYPNQFPTSAGVYNPPAQMAPSSNQQGLIQQFSDDGRSVQQRPVSQAGYGNSAPLQGLNAGPGALFPIGSAQAPQAPQGTSNGAAGNYQENRSPRPAVMNGAMYPHVSRVLPGEQQMMQMQQQGIRNNGMPTQQQYYPNTTSTAGNQQFGAGGVVNVQPISSTQVYGSAAQSPPEPGVPFPGQGQAGTNRNPMPNSPRAGASPLQAYERQLQSLDSQYNQALRQMDGSATALNPVQARY